MSESDDGKYQYIRSKFNGNISQDSQGLTETWIVTNLNELFSITREKERRCLS